jgi:hypothetical protein
MVWPVLERSTVAAKSVAGTVRGNPNKKTLAAISDVEACIFAM